MLLQKEKRKKEKQKIPPEKQPQIVLILNWPK